MTVNAISAHEFADLYKQGALDESYIMDVREPYEWEVGHLNKANHMPMNTVPERLAELDRDQTIFVMCAHGVRSWHVTQFLLNQGFEKIVNVEGGMAEVTPYIEE